VLLRVYEVAERIRYSDERLRAMLRAGQIRIQYYPVRGQEVVSATVADWLEPEDYLITTYRGLHDQIAKGVPLRELFAEYLGRASGTCGGKGGPMHVTDPASGLLVTTGIVGGGLPIANGVALASKLRNDRRVTVVSFGDGASNIGAFHEALNLAAVWELPVVFLCQNNLYGEHTAVEFTMRVANVADRACAYGMPGTTTDDSDVLALHEAVGVAVDRARSGGGPTLVEVRTFRFFGHAFGDDDSYMPKEQKEAALLSDPVTTLREALVSQEPEARQRIDALDALVHAEVDAALAAALADPYPDPQRLTEDVYA
jgi:pyruvate dehydrogenase E1 component alpha subunit